MGDDNPCINKKCEFHDPTLDLNCGGVCGGEPAIASCKRSRGIGPWIPITDKHPQRGQRCIVACGPDGVAQIMATTWDGDEFVWTDGYEYGDSAFDPLPSEMVTHWTPFPDDPRV